MYYLFPIELKILKRLMPGSELVVTLTTQDDYEVRTEAQLLRLRKELEAIPLGTLRKAPYPRGQYICSRTEADLVKMLTDAVDPVAP